MRHAKKTDLKSRDTQKELYLGSGHTEKELDLKWQYGFYFFLNHPNFHRNMCLILGLSAGECDPLPLMSNQFQGYLLQAFVSKLF